MGVLTLARMEFSVDADLLEDTYAALDTLRILRIRFSLS
jgi:hypothetical protein